jgi:hypothetical protein
MATKSRPKVVRRSFAIGAVLAVSSFLLAGCGGGGDAPPAPTPVSGPLTPSQRSAAAQTTAQSASNPCAAIRPFYWEIGDANAMLTSGSVEIGGGPPTVVATTPMAIASASKWLYGAYVAQKQNGALNAIDIKHLTFRSGYTSFSSCSPGQTVDDCVNAGSNGVYTAARDGFFFYDGGHMQKHASLFGLGALGNAALAAEMQTQLGADVTFGFSQPQLAGGAFSTAGGYAVFLRKMLAGTLRLGPLLGTQAVCTNSTTCAQALAAPVPASESWHYSLGHWVEDDPVVGDGAFSSAGAFGFYPWIDAGRAHYGVLARAVVQANAGYDSARCGRLIRKAWVTGAAQ